MDASQINPVFLKDLIIVVAVLAGVAASVLTAWRASGVQKRVIMDQPLKTEEVERPLSRDSVAHLHRRVDSLESDVKTIKQKMESDKIEIIQSWRDEARDMNLRIDGVPARTIALLKDTKGLLP